MAAGTNTVFIEQEDSADFVTADLQGFIQLSRGDQMPDGDTVIQMLQKMNLPDNFLRKMLVDAIEWMEAKPEN